MTTRRRYRLPGLQVPATLDPETFAFFNALKERLELLSGERGDPEARGVTLRELREAGVLKTTTQNRRSTVNAQRPPSDDDEETSTVQPTELDFSSYPRIAINAAPNDLQLLLQGRTPAERFSLVLDELLNTFARVDQSTDVFFPFSFQAEEHGWDISSPAPRFRLIELAENSDDEEELPADSAIWEFEVDAGVLTVYLVSDDEETRTEVLTIGRSGTVADYVNVEATALEHLGDQVLVEVGNGLQKTDRTVAVYEPEVDHNSLDNLDVGDPHPQYALRDVVVTPTELDADQNNYDPGEGSIVRLSASTPVTITGMVPGNRTLINVGAENITLANDDSNSDAENRFAFIADIIIPPNGSATLWYDEDSERHRCTAAVLT